MSIDLPAHPNVTPRSATASALSWFPPDGDGRGDIAIVEMDVPVPLMSSGLAASLSRPEPLWGRPVRVFGYPGAIDDGAWAEARLLGRGGPAGQWVQLDGMRTTGRRIERGFSGAGVIDAESGTILGIVVAEDRLAEAKIAWMLPTDVILGYWSSLGRYVADLTGSDSRTMTIGGQAITLGDLEREDDTGRQLHEGPIRLRPLLTLTRSTSHDGARLETLEVLDAQLAREFLHAYVQVDQQNAEVRGD